VISASGRTYASAVALLLAAVAACSPTAQPVATPEAAATSTPEPTPPPTPRTTIRFVAVGDIGQGNDVQRRVGARIVELHRQRPIDVLLLLGDIIYPDGAGHRYEERFAEPWRPVLDAKIAMAAALGNHDVQTDGGRDVMDLFEMPERYYEVDVGPATFYALDTNRFDAEQRRWLRDALAEDSAGWKIPFMHAPPYSSGMHGSTGSVRDGLDPILDEFEVPLTLAAHDHNYERTHPVDGTTHVVAGTACCLRPVERSDFTAVAFSEPGVVVGDLDGELLVLRFVHADGRVLDEVELTLAAAAVGADARG